MFNNAPITNVPSGVRNTVPTVHRHPKLDWGLRAQCVQCATTVGGGDIPIFSLGEVEMTISAGHIESGVESSLHYVYCPICVSVVETCL